jgi:2-polyprenyl-3-methyl-5-hydroxy-6-metoxy-1,4-benzoquinol methylase
MKTIEAILATNKKQKDFYNNTSKQNFSTKVWAKFRNGLLNKIRKNSGIEDKAYLLHKKWFGNLSNKKVLDLGCYAGNYWSLYLAENAKEYLGIDLSDVAIAKLNERLKPFSNAKAEAIDFLSANFEEKEYDLIYAYGVLHHFENSNILIDKLNEKLAVNGVIISYDPLQTSWPVRFIRILYRPFQSDAAWEWPFTKKTFYQFQKTFSIKERRGILGKSKWVVIVNFLPISDKKKRQISEKWHNEDWVESSTSDRAMFCCMHLTMLMQKK